MIKKKTVLVLGAGASASYGFPLGAGVTNVLAQQAAEIPNSQIQRELAHHCGLSPAEVASFLNAFSRSGLSSVDSFLARRPELAPIGKYALAWVLCQGEGSWRVFTRSNDDHWYSGLWDAMLHQVRTLDEFRQNRIKIITFNYDRSLECFLHEATKNTFGIEDAQALDLWKSIPILRVYGGLGEFSFDGRAGTRRYEATIDGINLKAAADGIVVLPEARDDADQFKLARAWFDWSEHICFLGFGFDPLNLSRLGLVDVIRHRREAGSALPGVFATVFGKTDSEVGWIRQSLVGDNHSAFASFGCKNLVALRNTPILQ